VTGSVARAVLAVLTGATLLTMSACGAVTGTVVKKESFPFNCTEANKVDVLDYEGKPNWVYEGCSTGYNLLSIRQDGTEIITNVQVSLNEYDRIHEGDKYTY
jgi:hypothetical protein